MSFQVLLVLAVGFLTSECSGVDISAIPQAMPDFNIYKYLGIWNNIGKVAPCSFTGSKKFSDWVINFQLDGKKGQRVIITSNWRVGEQCVNNIRTILTERYPGCYTVQDPIGDVTSGVQKIVATDYKRFSIWWGCTKWSVDELTCNDPWLSIETRMLNPDPLTLNIIDQVLRKMFGFGFEQTNPVQHGNPCIAYH